MAKKEKNHAITYVLVQRSQRSILVKVHGVIMN